MSRLLLLFAVLFMVGCSTPIKKQEKQISTLIHTQEQAFRKGRLDIAKKINTQLTKLVPAPKRAAIIHEFKKQEWGDGSGIFSKKTLLSETVYTVLPENTDIKNIIVNGSPEFNKLLAETPSARSAEDKNDKQLNLLEDRTESIRRDKESAAQKYGKKTWLDSVFSWVFGLSFMGIVLLVIIAFLFPTLFPVIISLIIRFVKTIISSIISIINSFKNG